MASLIAPRPAKKARKVLIRRVEGAIAEVEKPGPLEPRLHQARRQLKKARATLKLLRPAIPKKLYKAENALCRDAGRILSATRDAQALQTAWKSLRIHAPEVEWALAEDAQRAAAGLQTKKIRQILQLARAQAAKIAPARPSWKGVKDQRYQVDLFLDGSASIRKLDETLDQLSDLLGDAHDLVVLRAKVGDDHDEALRAIDRKQAELRQKALALAERVYAEPADDFVRSVKRAWKRSR